jgi:hypothetical protein
MTKYSPSCAGIVGTIPVHTFEGVRSYLLVCTIYKSRLLLPSVLRVRDVYPGFRICIKEFKYFDPKKWFLST